MTDTLMKLDGLTSGARALLGFTPLTYMQDFVQENPWGAQVYADDEVAPTRCAMQLGHYLFLSESADDAFVALLADALYPADKRRELGVTIVFYKGDQAAQAVRRHFGKAWDNMRSVYRLAAAVAADAPMEGVAPVTNALLASGTDNVQMVTQEVLGTGTYRDMDDFCRRGVGYAYVRDGRVRGFCTSEYPSKRALAVGIEVEESDQRRGIATAMTRAFTADAVKRGVDVYWECWMRNEPSFKTALKCGFEKVADYPVLFVDWSE